MFLINLKKTKLYELIKKFEPGLTKTAQRFFNLPKTIDFDKVFYFFNKEKETITYVLFYENNKKSFAFEVNSGCEITSLFSTQNEEADRYYYQNNTVYDYIGINAIKYIYNEDEKLYKENKEAFIAKYKDVYEVFGDNLIKDFEKIQKNLSYRHEFLSLIEEINKTSSLLTTEDKKDIFGNYQIDSEIEEYDEKRYIVRFRIGLDRKLIIKNLEKFINTLHSGGKFFVSKTIGNIDLVESNFNKTSQKILDFIGGNYITINKTNSYYNDLDSSYGFVPLQSIHNLLLANLNRNIIFNKENIFVKEKITEGYITLDKDEVLTFTPNIKNIKFDKAYISDRYLFYIKHNELNLIEFQNHSSVLVYYFFLNHKDFAPKNISDLLDNKLSNTITKIVQKNEDEQTQNDLEISLYISSDFTKNVEFKTVYRLNGIEETKENLTSNFYYKTLINQYNLILKNYNFLENGVSKDPISLVNVMASDYSSLNDVAKTYLSEAILAKRNKKLSKIKINATYNNGLLDINFSSSDFNSEEIELILNAYRKKEKFIVIKDDFIPLTNNAELEKIEEIFSEFSSSKQVPLYQCFKLDNYMKDDSNVVDVDFDSKIREIILEIKSFKDSEITLDPQIKKYLKPYQLDGVKYLSVLAKNHLAGILADDMGLGKTLEMIAFISTIKTSEPVLIVSPKNVIYNWKDEFNKWDKSKKVTVIDGLKSQRKEIIDRIKNNGEIYIISYDSLRNDIEQFKNLKFSLIVLDEAQYIKNASALKTHAVKELQSESRFALTGTPIENSLIDLWSIFDFLMPNYLLNQNSFINEYQKGYYDNDQTVRSRLIAKINPFILRRKKSEVLKELPPKTTSIIKLDMYDKQKELYGAFLAQTRTEVDEINSGKENKSRISILAALTRLRQICVDPNSFIENYDDPSVKIDYTISLLKEATASGHKVIVFSAFTSVLDNLKEKITDNDMDTYCINGTTPGQLRVTLANNFNTKNDVNIFLVSLKAGGIGLNLTAADTVIHLDPWWNFAAEEQATDRAYRIGQVNPVMVYKLITHGTIEEKVIELQEKKRHLYDDVVKSGSSSITSMTDADIEFLLS